MKISHSQPNFKRLNLDLSTPNDIRPSPLFYTVSKLLETATYSTIIAIDMHIVVSCENIH